MADLTWIGALKELGGGDGGGVISGKSIDSVAITDAGDLEITFSDGTVKNAGRVVGEDGKVYVPHIDEHKILTFTIEDGEGEIPDPVDLNPSDEWNDMGDDGMDSPGNKTDYVWEGM